MRSRIKPTYKHHQGRRNWGGQEGSRPRCPLPGGARGAKVPFQFKGLPWRNSELSEMLVQFFYEFASKTQEMQSSSFKNSWVSLRHYAVNLTGGQPQMY
jgi:hypothetical protein